MAHIWFVLHQVIVIISFTYIQNRPYVDHDHIYDTIKLLLDYYASPNLIVDPCNTGLLPHMHLFTQICKQETSRLIKLFFTI
jgi:hypothetical protein